MSYERYKDYRLAPDDNGCWDILNSDYDQKGTYPSKAAAKRAIDDMSLPRSTPQGGNTPGATPTPPESEIDAILDFYFWSLDKTKEENRQNITKARFALSRLIAAEVRRAQLQLLDDLKPVGSWTEKEIEVRIVELEAGSGEATK